MAKDELFDNIILRIGNAKTNLRLATFRTWTENKKESSWMWGLVMLFYAK